MAKSNQLAASITPEQCLAELPELFLELEEKKGRDEDLRRSELRQSLLAITGLDPNSESAMVRQTVENALGRLPDLEE